MSIFKAYDIRGTVPDQLDPELARRIGWATARFLGVPALVVGRDARQSSPLLTDALMSGVNEAGVDVIDVGLVTTPMVYYGIESLEAGGGIMVTASHNPGQYNGFKIAREHAIPVGGETGLAEIQELATERFEPQPGRQGTRCTRDLRRGYVEHVFSVAEQRPALRLAIDCGNGMAGVALESVLERLPCSVERLYFEPDGNFPNHPADPLEPENLRDLIAAVKRTGADLGVAFDGDADRAIFVDETGAPASADLVTALLAREILRQQPGGTVLYDLRSSRATAEEIEAAGGVAKMCRVGHAFIKAAMRESGAVFAGELSGHFYFRFSKNLVADDGVAAFLALLGVLGREGRPLSELMAPLRRYHATGELNRKVGDVSTLLQAIEKEHADAPLVSHLDGLLVRYPDWWFNVRPSNTEPLVRLNLEAESREQMERQRDVLLARIEAAG